MAARKKQKETKNGKGLVKKSAGPLRSKAEKKLREQEGRLKDRSAVSDISEQKQAEDALSASEEKYRSIFEGANDGIIACDLTTGKFLFANERFSALTGYSREEIVKLGVKDIHPEKDLPFVLNEFNEIAGGKKTETREIPVLTKDKNVIYCDISSSFLGETILIGFFRNVTERKRAEEALIQAKEEWERTFASVPDMIALLDNNHSIIRVNESMAKCLGCKPDECIGMKCYEAVHGTTSPPDFCPHSRTIKDGREHVQEIHEEHLGMDLLVTTTPLFDEQGQMTGSVHVAHDISGRKRAEQERERLLEELKKSNTELAAVNKELEAYSYTISHDLRAPLRSIEGFSRAIMEDYADKLDATGRDYFLRVTSASRRMMQLIDALLTMSRLTQSEIKEKVVNLSDAVNVIAHELTQSQPERIVEFVIAKKVSANGDPDMLRIVLENLLNNAWKFTSKHPAARIEFGVTRIDDKDVYFVRDDGAGFDMQFADKLFNPFRRFHAEAEFPGLGIGLATTQKIITRHGGKIWAESAPEKGATFYFTL